TGVRIVKRRGRYVTKSITLLDNSVQYCLINYFIVIPYLYHISLIRKELTISHLYYKLSKLFRIINCRISCPKIAFHLRCHINVICIIYRIFLLFESLIELSIILLWIIALRWSFDGGLFFKKKRKNTCGISSIFLKK